MAARYDAIIITNLCVPTASGVPLQRLPKQINGVRIIGVDVPGFGVPTHAEAKDVLAGAMLNYARLEAEQGPVLAPRAGRSDKPTVTLETPRDPDRVSSFLNIRVADVHAVYDEWNARGAQFLTPPKQHQYEIRCYIRDPDGYLIEVGQTTDTSGDWVPDHWPSDLAGQESE